jgi:hypothetical protein
MKLDQLAINKLKNKLDKFRVIKESASPDDCYGWSGAIRKGCTPCLYIKGSSINTNRAAWIVEFGEIPDFHYVLITCNNKTCTNPKHLKLSRSKPRKRSVKSKRPGRDRLSLHFPTEIVADIRRLASKYNMTITRYLLQRLIEIIEFERDVDSTRNT